MVERFERFTDRARRVLTLAEEEAHGFNHHYIGTEHLLLGLVREGDGVAARALADLGVQPPQVREAVEYVVGRGDAPATAPLALVPRAERTIELAVEEAGRLGHQYVGTEHLLLGLVREGQGVGAGVLESLGVTDAQIRERLGALVPVPNPLQTVRDQVVRALKGRRGGEPGGAKGNVVTCRIDDRDLAAIDALVEAGIRSTRSDAASWLIHAGVEANQALFEKVTATLAEIRRLRGEAREIARQFAAEPPAPGERPAASDDQGNAA